MPEPAILFDIGRKDGLATSLVRDCKLEAGGICVRQFPDGESYIRLMTKVGHRDVIFLADLSRPDTKALRLIFAAKAAMAQGAIRIGLIAPYLPYMRQDKMFKSGEAVTSQSLASLLDDTFDWMVTVDPHLHRITDLKSLFSLTPLTLHVTKPITSWVASNVEKPLIIGPDIESHQWVSSVAKAVRAPYIIANKSRFGDRCIEVDMPNLEKFRDRTPVIIDDIISTGTTFSEAINAIGTYGLASPVCIAVHALLSPKIEAKLILPGASKIVTTNTVPHQTNLISVNKLIGASIKEFLAAPYEHQPRRYV